MLNLPKSFCILPFLHHHLTVEGDMTPCCLNYQVMGNVNEKSMEEIFQGEGFRKLREQILGGELPLSCQNCKNAEDFGIPSMRQEVNTRFKKDVLTLNLIADKSGRLPYYRPKYLDIRFSNFCNLKCRTCGPLASTSWGKEEGVGLIKLSAKVKDDLIALLPQTEEVYLAGGEPLIMEENISLVDQIKKVNKNIRIVYNTNLSTLSFRSINYLDYWKDLKGVNLILSLDDIHERGEYIRSGLNFSHFMKNTRLLTKAGIPFTFNVVVGAINAFSMKELFDFFREHFPDERVNFTLLLTPVQLRLSAMPQVIREILAKELTSLLAMDLPASFTAFLKVMLSELEEDHTEHFEELKNYIKSLDRRRGESFQQVYPDHPLAAYF